MFAANSSDYTGQGKNIPAGTAMSGYGGGTPGPRCKIAHPSVSRKIPKNLIFPENVRMENKHVEI